MKYPRIAVFLVACMAACSCTCLTPGPAPARIAMVKTLALAKNPATAPQLREALGDHDPIVRRLAVYGLQRIGDPAASAAILPLLNDSDAWVQRTAVVALGELRDVDSARPLLPLLKADDMTLRYETFVALGKIAAPYTQQPILKALRDPRLWTEVEPWNQMALLRVIDRDWFTDPGGRDVLKRLLDHGEFEPSRRERYAGLLIANQAAVTLALKYGDASGERYLVEGLGGDAHMQQRSAMAAGHIRSRAAVSGLIAMLNNRWLLNRRYALRALGQIADPASVEAVSACLDHKDIRVRRTAAEAYRKITGTEPEADLSEPAAATMPQVDPSNLDTPGNKLPPQFIVLGIDDCSNIEGLESILDIVETLREHDQQVVFTLWLAPLGGYHETRDILKQTVLLQRLFDLGCEIAHHTLHHNPGGHNWSSLPRERQVEEIEGCTQWYRDNIDGFTRPFTYKGGGGGRGNPPDPEFTRDLLMKQNFIYSGKRGAHPRDQAWPDDTDRMLIPTGKLDAAAPPVHATITDGIVSDYPGQFDYELEDGVKMWIANFDYHYRHPRRPILAVNAFHDWAFKTQDASVNAFSHRNEGPILKEFLLEVLVRQKDKYPETHCVTFRQIVEYVRSNGDLERTLKLGNGQDSRRR